jgi:cytoskeleton protein RodZ
VDIGIGATLREARKRRKIDLSQVEAATRIRARYLRAIESEDWDLLPGDVYARGFIRTYASYLGLDGERLADDYRRSSAAQRGDGPPAGPEPTVPIARPGATRRLSGRVWGVLVTLGVVALLIGLGLSDGGDDSAPAPLGKSGGADGRGSTTSAPMPAQPGVAVRLAATAEVWVCLLDAQGRPLVNGQILLPGAEEGPFRSDSFTVAFGNGEVSMTIDGKEADIPATSSPIGYAIVGGTLEPLSEGERPTCT